MENYTQKAACYDSFRADSPGWESIQSALENTSPGLRMLDLGTGTGAFLPRLATLQPSLLEAVDPNEEMVKRAQTRHKELCNDATSPLAGVRDVIVRVAGEKDLPSDNYDLVLSAQVLQNLTSVPEKAAEARKIFLKEVVRTMRPGAKLIITTRFCPRGGRWSDLHWYADPAVVPNAVYSMEHMVPKFPEEELSEAGLTDCKIITSPDTVIRKDAYLNPDNVRCKSFRCADSFFQHLKDDELSAMLANFDRLRERGELEQYVRDRNALRAENGHVVTVVGIKPL